MIARCPDCLSLICGACDHLRQHDDGTDLSGSELPHQAALEQGRIMAWLIYAWANGVSADALRVARLQNTRSFKTTSQAIDEFKVHLERVRSMFRAWPPLEPGLKELRREGDAAPGRFGPFVEHLRVDEEREHDSAPAANVWLASADGRHAIVVAGTVSEARHLADEAFGVVYAGLLLRRMCPARRGVANEVVGGL